MARGRSYGLVMVRRLIAGAATAALSLGAWAAAPSAAALASSGPVSTTTTSTLDFSTTGQGMWGPGAPTNLASGSVNLFPPLTWNKSASASNITTLSVDKNLDVDSTSGLDTDGDGTNDTDRSCTTWNNDWNGSFSEDGEINGQDNDNDLASDGQTCVDSNGDIDYVNVDTDGDANNQNDLANTYWGGSVSAQTSGSIGLEMALQNLDGGSVSVNYPVSVSQTVSAPGSYVKGGDQVTFASSWHAQSGASLATTPATGAAGLDGTFGLSASASGQICVGACSNDTVLGFNIPSKTYTLFSPVGSSESASGPGVTGTIAAPSFGVGPSALSGNTLSATGSLPFWKLDVSLDGMVQGLTNIPLSSSSSVAGVNFGYDILSANASPAYSSTQSLTFSPTLLETLAFSQPVAYTAYDGQDNVYGSGTSASVSFPADGKAVVTIPSIATGSLTYTTSYSLSGADFTNNSALQGSVSSNLSALSLNASFQNAGALNLGPVYQTSGSASYNIPLLGAGSPFGLTTSSWALGGFPLLSGATGALQVDSIPPTTTASLSGPLGGGGWYTGAVQVTLSAQDNPGGSGVAATYYSIDGGPTQTYSAPFTVSGDGTHSVQYYSVDNAGNVEQTQSVSVKVDQTPPTTTASLQGHLVDGWYSGPGGATLTLLAQDNPGGSGVAATYYSVNGGPQQTYTQPVAFPNGTFSVSYDSQDVAGNVEATQTIAFKVDVTPPTTTAALAGTLGGGGWYRSPVQVTLTAQDNPGGSGVAATYYSVDSGPLAAYSAPFTVSGDGTHSVQYYSVDNAGNVEATKSATVKIDQTPPTTTEAVTGTVGNNGWYKAGSPVVLTLTATDNNGGSGVASTTYSVNGGAPQTYTQPVTFKDGTYTITYGSTDVAGNVETPHTMSLKVDQTPPVVTYTGNAGTYTIDQTVDITCSASDNLSGVASTTCSSLDEPAYELPLGSHTLSATATDNAGNVGTGSTTFTVTVTYASLCGLTDQFESKAGVAQALCSKLQAAAAKAASGDTNAAHHILAAYENELAAQTGKSISAADVKILDGFVTDLENMSS